MVSEVVRKNHVAVVGLGLMGGSLARRLLCAGYRVSVWNHRPDPYEQAAREGLWCADSLASLLARRPQVAVVCTSLRAMPQVIDAMAPHIDMESTTLTDVGSVKVPVRAMVASAGLSACYVGAHPMAGNERSGWGSADAALYDNALWALTVDEQTDYARWLSVARLVTDVLRNQVVVCDDAAHDRAAALISHMPHVLSTALINALVDDGGRQLAAALAAGSWRDMTRVALTDPQRTQAMVQGDAANVAALLRDMARRCTDAAQALEQGDVAWLDEFFRHGDPFRRYREHQAGACDTLQEGALRRTMTLHPEDWRNQLCSWTLQGWRILAVRADGSVDLERRLID